MRDRVHEAGPTALVAHHPIPTGVRDVVLHRSSTVRNASTHFTLEVRSIPAKSLEGVEVALHQGPEVRVPAVARLHQDRSSVECDRPNPEEEVYVAALAVEKATPDAERNPEGGL